MVDQYNGGGKTGIVLPDEQPPEDKKLKRAKIKAAVAIIVALLATAAITYAVMREDIVDLETTVTERQQTIDQLNMDLNESFLQQTETEAELATKTQVLEATTQRLAEMQEQLEETQQVVVQLEDTITEINTVVRQQTEYIDKIETTPIKLTIPINDNRFVGQLGVEVGQPQVEDNTVDWGLARVNLNRIRLKPIPVMYHLECVGPNAAVHSRTPPWAPLQAVRATAVKAVCAPPPIVIDSHEWYKPQGSDLILMTASFIAGQVTSFWFWEVRN
jgi:hypothetical protein